MRMFRRLGKVLLLMAAYLAPTGLEAGDSTSSSSRANASAKDQLELESLLSRAYANHPSLQALRDASRALEERASAQSALKDPMIGIRLERMGEGTSRESRRTVMVEQAFEFPKGSRLRSDIAKVQAAAVKLDVDQYRWDMRSQLVTSWYALQSVLKIKDIIRKDLEKMRELSRTAESKYAAGTTGVQDSMRAHYVQTEIEAELIELEREESELTARLTELVAAAPGEVSFPRLEKILIPVISMRDEVLGGSFVLQSREKEVETAGLTADLARWQFAPEFRVGYEQGLGEGEDSARMISLQMSVPLWFWGKTAEARSAGFEHEQKKHELQASQRKVAADIATLKARTNSDGRMLEIIQTSLIPQATTSADSLHGAYKARRATLSDVLDAERSLLRVEMTYWRTLTRFVEGVTQLEAALGHSVSNIIF